MTHTNKSDTLQPSEIASKIDHTLLKPTLLEADLDQLCQEAVGYGFKTVCVPPAWVVYCAQRLQNTSVGTITVVGFPLGYSTSASKAFEASDALQNGAVEIDMVVQISWVKNGKWKDVGRDIEAVVKASGTAPVKVILETAYLSRSEKIETAKIAERAGARFVKTSTGFATGVPNPGASLADIQLLRDTLQPSTLIKASGGIRDLETALALLQAGAHRLGTSSGVSILKGLRAEHEY